MAHLAAADCAVEKSGPGHAASGPHRPAPVRVCATVTVFSTGTALRVTLCLAVINSLKKVEFYYTVCIK